MMNERLGATILLVTHDAEDVRGLEARLYRL